MRRTLVVPAALVLLSRLAAGAVVTESWDWKTECRNMHAKFTGTEGVVCHFGDSITYSNPYSQWIRWGSGRTTSDNDLRTWMHINQGDTGQRRAPTDFTNILIDWGNDGWFLAYQDNNLNMASPTGSYTARSGIRADQYLGGGLDLPQVEDMMDNYNPEIVVLMLGTNDASANHTPAAFKADLENIIKRILYNDGDPANGYRGCVPIVSTIPPKRGDMTDVTNYNTQIVALAQTYKLPLIDFCGEVLARQPADWDGTLISGDGVHPSAAYFDSGPPLIDYDTGSDPYANGGDALKYVGYLLRCWLSVQKIKDVKTEVIDYTGGGGGGGGGCSADLRRASAQGPGLILAAMAAALFVLRRRARRTA